jgi:hypothetical protein
MEDGRCKLGLAGRLELVRLIESGSTLRAAAAALNVAGDGAPVVASVVGGERAGAALACVLARQAAGAEVVPVEAWC